MIPWCFKPITNLELRYTIDPVFIDLVYSRIMCVVLQLCVTHLGTLCVFLLLYALYSKRLEPGADSLSCSVIVRARVVLKRTVTDVIIRVK